MSARPARRVDHLAADAGADADVDADQCFALTYGGKSAC